MVVGLALAAVQMGMALPTGFLFGVGYGTGVRIGYEQVYPLLFPKGARPTTTELAATMKGMNTVYDAIGGKDASRMGIAVGITNAGEILNNPDFRVLEQLESSSSGLTSSSSSRSRFGLDNPASSPREVLSSEIDAFNTSTGAEKYVRYRTYTIQQLLNIISSSTNQESITIAGKVLAEKQLNPQQTSSSTSTATLPPAPRRAATTKEQEFNTWRDIVFKLEKRFQQLVAGQNIQRRSDLPQEAKDIRRQIVIFSRQYRSPNNSIRRYALKLRNNLNSGFYAL